MPAKPFDMRLRTSLPVCSSITGAPGIAISTTAKSSWPRRPDGEPAEVAHLRQRHVGANLHAELVGVEGERLVLVVNP